MLFCLAPPTWVVLPHVLKPSWREHGILGKVSLKEKIGTYIVVGRRRIGVAVNEIEEYLSRLGMVKIPGVSGYAFKKGEILEDREALKEAKRLGRQILRLCGKTGF